MSNDVLSLSDDHVFYTVEGEGKYIGWPYVFMRMAMCNLTCKDLLHLIHLMVVTLLFLGLLRIDIHMKSLIIFMQIMGTIKN